MTTKNKETLFDLNILLNPFLKKIIVFFSDNCYYLYCYKNYNYWRMHYENKKK